MAGKDLVTIDGTITSADVVAYCQNPGGFAIKSIVRDPDEVAAEMMADALGAESPDALFGGGEVLHAKEYVNRPFILNSVSWQHSQIEGPGLEVYAVLRLTDQDGRPQVMTTSAEKICLKVAIADSKGWLPQPLKITEAVTAQGYKVLDIVAASIAAGDGTDRPF